MRIILSDTEILEIRLPEEMTKQQLDDFVRRLGTIVNYASSIPVANAQTQKQSQPFIPKTYKVRKKRDSLRFKENREIALNYLRAYYCNDDWRSAWITMDKAYNSNMSGSNISYVIRTLKDLHKFTPQEVGLIRFPKGGADARKIKSLRL